jgi:hypothetical protein
MVCRFSVPPRHWSGRIILRSSGPRGSGTNNPDYAIALGEKQKLRYQYGLLERSSDAFSKAHCGKRGVTGETLLQLLRRGSTTSFTDSA